MRGIRIVNRWLLCIGLMVGLALLCAPMSNLNELQFILAKLGAFALISCVFLTIRELEKKNKI